MLGIVIVQMILSGSQAWAQPIFRTPKQAGAVEKPSLQLTELGEVKMAPIRGIGSGEISSSTFQLPQTSQTGDFIPGALPPRQSNPAPQQGLREVGADGSFLPVERFDEGGDNQRATIDLPGLDLSALGIGADNQQDGGVGQRPDRNGRFSDADDQDLEQLPLTLGQTEVPQEQGSGGNLQREQVVENYADGKPRLLRTVALDRDGNYYNDGLWMVKDRDGKTVAAGSYRKGVMHGQWARRHTSAEQGMFVEKPFTLFQGPFDSIANFKSGKLHGQWIVYDRTKRSIFEIGYENGKRDGLATWFYPDTTKMRQATFKQGMLDGEVSEWDEDGRLVSKEYYKKGRKLIRNTSFYRPKVPKEESYFLDVTLEQDGLDNWWDAKPAPYLASGERVQSGQARAWYSNQQLQYQGQFRDDKPIGRFFWWHENGNRSIVGQFNRAGDRDSRWVWWHDNGLKKIEGDYKDDQPSGVWRSWDRSGKLIKTKDFDKLTEEFEDQVDPLDDADPKAEETLMEGTVKTGPAEDALPSVLANDAIGSGATIGSGETIGSGLIQDEEEGFLPLPQGDTNSEELPGAIEPPEESEPTQEQQYESLPPALDGESEPSNEDSMMRRVSTELEQSGPAIELNFGRSVEVEPPVDFESNADSIQGHEDVEAFDLSGFLE